MTMGPEYADGNHFIRRERQPLTHNLGHVALGLVSAARRVLLGHEAAGLASVHNLDVYRARQNKPAEAARIDALASMDDEFLLI